MKLNVKNIKTRIFKRNDGKNFLHFFVAFSIIFFVLTSIILNILATGIYKSTDQNLRNLAQSPLLSQLVEGNQMSSNMTNSPHPGNFGPTNSILIYDAAGKLIYPKSQDESTTDANRDNNAGLPEISSVQLEKAVHFDPSAVGSIRMLSVPSSYGGNYHYRYLTLNVTQVDTNGNSSWAYMQIFSNVDQLQEGLQRSRFIIITTMVIFWLLSIMASLYLAAWTRRPVVAAFERQKSFVENASHELRTPLAILQNRLELLFQNPNATILDESENISESLQEVRNMRLLTSNLLNLARRDSGIKIEPEETGLPFFKSLFANYEMLAENAGKQFSGQVDLDENIMLDQALTKQLMTILFDNALKYTDDDGEVKISVQKLNNQLNIIVSDNGEGISDQDKKKVFDRFYRVDKARTRQKGGLGLGLSLAKQIVDAYKGKVSVEDNHPKGTRFNIRLRLEK
ncbi:sensor histidine kinase [Lactococcus termiticola]|nr:HAMP domain-containing sensor histidine kinase [Lactococcus termiticola]